MEEVLKRPKGPCTDVWVRGACIRLHGFRPSAVPSILPSHLAACIYLYWHALHMHYIHIFFVFFHFSARFRKPSRSSLRTLAMVLAATLGSKSAAE